jgi:peroxiredoxin
MTSAISLGDEAPNFDLSSTEGCVLMLRDEVIRTAVVLYFFADPESDRVERDLSALSRRRDGLARLRTKVLAVAPLPMARLLGLQRSLDLRFPLLRDDRDFSRLYGVAAAAEGQPPAPALVVVDRRQRVRWLANPVAGAADALPQIEKLLAALPSPTASYPRRVVNRLVDRWVN